MPNAAAIYCRLSYAPDGSLEKVERQEADCRALAARLGWPVREVYCDNSRSAWQRNRKRPGWDALLAGIDAGELDAVIVYHGDRLIRQPYDLEKLINIADSKGIRLASVAGTRNLDNPDDRYILRIEAAGFCRSSDDTSRRVRRGWEARAKQGRPVGGGKRPFGYGVPTGRTGKTGKPLYDVTRQVPDEARVLREAIERLMAGQSLGGVLAWMNTVSTTTQGNRWTAKSLKNILYSPRIAGLVEHKGTLYQAVWDGIVTPEEWEDVKALLRQRAEAYGQPARQRRYLLSGIAECSGCGHGLRVRPSGGRNRRTARLYYCPNPDCRQRVGRSVEHLDAYVEGRVLRRVNEPTFLDEVLASEGKPGVGAEIAALERRRAEARAQLERLADHPELSPELITRSLESFTRRIDELRARQEMTARQRLLRRVAGVGRDEWVALPLDVRAETVRALFRVVVLPATWRGPGFDPSSVDLIPRMR